MRRFPVTTNRAVAGSEPPTRVRWVVLNYLVAASFVLYLLLLTLSYFCMNYVFYIFFNWFYIYLPALATGSFFAIVGAAAWLAIRADHPLTRNRGVAR